MLTPHHWLEIMTNASTVPVSSAMICTMYLYNLDAKEWFQPWPCWNRRGWEWPPCQILFSFVGLSLWHSTPRSASDRKRGSGSQKHTRIVKFMAARGEWGGTRGGWLNEGGLVGALIFNRPEHSLQNISLMIRLTYNIACSPKWKGYGISRKERSGTIFLTSKADGGRLSWSWSFAPLSTMKVLENSENEVRKKSFFRQ